MPTPDVESAGHDVEPDDVGRSVSSLLVQYYRIAMVTHNINTCVPQLCSRLDRKKRVPTLLCIMRPVRINRINIKIS